MYPIHGINSVGIPMNPPNCKQLCRWLGPAHQVVQAFFSYIILDNAHHIAQSSVIGIPQDEFLSYHIKKETKKFMTSLESLL